MVRSSKSICLLLSLSLTTACVTPATLETESSEDIHAAGVPLAAPIAARIVRIESKVGACFGTRLDGPWILSSAHCVFRSEGAVTVRFTEGSPQRLSSAQGQAVRYPDYRIDLALVRSSAPLPALSPPALRLASAADTRSDIPVMMAGYPSAKAETSAPLQQYRGRIDQVEGAFLVVPFAEAGSCDNEAGAPLFAQSETELVLLGLGRPILDDGLCLKERSFTATAPVEAWVKSVMNDFAGALALQAKTPVPHEFHVVDAGVCLSAQAIDVYRQKGMEGYQLGSCPLTITVEGQSATHIGYINLETDGFRTHIYSKIIGDDGTLRDIDEKSAGEVVDDFQAGWPPAS